MTSDLVFDDIRQKLKVYDRFKSKHPIIPILEKLGVKKETISKALIENDLVCRATAYNICNGTSEVKKESERALLELLRMATIESIKISKNYRKIHKQSAISIINNGIREARIYLEQLNEPLEGIDFQGIGDVWSNCIKVPDVP